MTTGRVFVIVLTSLAYAIALSVPASDLRPGGAVRVHRLRVARRRCLSRPLFWRGSTKWGALASTLWVAFGVLGIAAVNANVPAPPPGQATPVWTLAGHDVIARTPAGPSVLGFMPVVPMVLVSSLLLFVVSALTPRPSAATVARYFPDLG